MLETRYQAKLIKRLEQMFPGCIILRNDPKVIQGVSDLIILWGNHWAGLEVKASSKASERPNQGYYIDKMNEMSFAAFVFPENEEEVLNGLQLAFSVG